MNGGLMARPITVFVKEPPLLSNTTRSLKTPSFVGLKLTTRFVKVDPSKVKGVPERIAKPPVTMLADPSKVAEPALLTTKVACPVAPIASRPKSRFVGVTASWAGLIKIM